MGIPPDKLLDDALDFDPLAYFDGCARPVRDAASLRREVEAALAEGTGAQKRLMDWALAARADCLSALTPAALDQFLPDAQAPCAA